MGAGAPISAFVRRLTAVAREHRLLVAVLVAAVVLRALVEVAYWPALFYADSWQYVNLAFSKTIVAFGVDRPSGYPLLIHLLSAFGRSLAVLTVIQHLAGLATGVLVYALLLHLRCPKLGGRWARPWCCSTGTRSRSSSTSWRRPSSLSRSCSPPSSRFASATARSRWARAASCLPVL